jgi:hypothetical protein
MNKILPVLLFLLFAEAGFAQKDTVVTNLPMVDGKLVYSGSVNITARDSIALDSTANNWLKSYFKYHRPCPSPPVEATTGSISSQAVLEYKVKPGLINIPYYGIINILITCKNNSYSYKIYDIHFRPKSGTLNAIGYERNPEYLIALYKQKHIGLIKSMSIDKHEIRNYLSNMNSAVLECIASLKKAMTNK